MVTTPKKMMVTSAYKNASMGYPLTLWESKTLFWKTTILNRELQQIIYKRPFFIANCKIPRG
jgi:hypothetical protein